MVAGPNQPVEARLVAEYCALTFPTARVLQRVRLGALNPALELPTMTPEERRLAGVWRRWADAVVIEPARVTIIEAAVIPQPGKIAQLDLYLALWPRTAEFREYGALPLRGLLVSAVDDPLLRMLCRQRRLLMDVYRPRWVDAWFATLPPRKTRAPLA